MIAKMNVKYVLTALVACAFALQMPVRADSIAVERPVTRATLYGVGWANVFDTYLSPQEYRGIDFRMLRESTRQTKWADGRLQRQTLFMADMSYTHNLVDNNNTMAALVNWNWGLHYCFPLAPNFRLLAGGLIDLNGGFVYNLRNGNNPAQARAYVNLDASVIAEWKVRMGRFPVALRYQLNVPLAGAMFMPHYGQSYYEIFSLGHGSGVVHFTSLHNQPSLRQLITADFPIRKLCKLRVGYVWDAQQAKLNDIKVHSYGHAFLVGFVKQFVLKP